MCTYLKGSFGLRVSPLPDGLARLPVVAFASLKPDPANTFCLDAVIADVLASRSVRARKNDIHKVAKLPLHRLGAGNSVQPREVVQFSP